MTWALRFLCRPTVKRVHLLTTSKLAVVWPAASGSADHRGLGDSASNKRHRVYTRALLAATTFHLIGEIPLDKCSLDSLEERAQHETSNELSGLVHPKPCVFDSPFFIKS